MHMTDVSNSSKLRPSRRPLLLLLLLLLALTLLLLLLSELVLVTVPKGSVPLVLRSLLALVPVLLPGLVLTGAFSSTTPSTSTAHTGNTFAIDSVWCKAWARNCE